MAFDPNDPRVKQLLQALQGQGGGKPMFGGMSHVQGGQSIRGRADYFRPGFAGINYNPLAAQMANGAPGLLGLNSGHDSNPPTPGAPTGTGGTPTGAPAPDAGQGVAPPLAPNPSLTGGPPAPSPSLAPSTSPYVAPDPGTSGVYDPGTAGAVDPSMPDFGLGRSSTGVYDRAVRNGYRPGGLYGGIYGNF